MTSTTDLLAAAANAQGFVLTAYRRMTADGETFIVAGFTVADPDSVIRTAILDLDTGALTDLRRVATDRPATPAAVAVDAAIAERQAEATR